MTDKDDVKKAADEHADDKLKEGWENMSPEQRSRIRGFDKELKPKDDKELIGIPEHLADYVRVGEMSDTEFDNFANRTFKHYKEAGNG